MEGDPKFTMNERGFWVSRTYGDDTYDVTDGIITLRRAGKKLRRAAAIDEELEDPNTQGTQEVTNRW